MTDQRNIGLALSGGGSRAIAFHLGCMRALHDRGALSKVSVLSTVSGGSIIGALWAYSDLEFDEFDIEIRKLLRTGLTKGIIRQTLFSLETIKILLTNVVSGAPALLGDLFLLAGYFLSLLSFRSNPFPLVANWISKTCRRYSSRSTAFERHLRKNIFGSIRLDQVQKPNLQVVINASELRTGTAFRYGSKETGSWRLGVIQDHVPMVSQAVASSAAFPAFLPTFDQIHSFKDKSGVQNKRVLISDGGVYENLGISCLVPGRSSAFATNVHEIDFIISCDAGQGVPLGDLFVYHWGGRMNAAVESIYRRATNQGYRLLHDLAENDQITGFLLPYLGQQDASLPHRPSNLIGRSQVVNYPTDFSAMTESNIELLSQRGEQLTRILIEHYHPEL